MNKEQVIIDFKWTDELVHSYVRELITEELGKEYNHMDKFKAAHQPPQNEWEVVEMKRKDGSISKWGRTQSGYDSNEDWVHGFLNYCPGSQIWKVQWKDEAPLEVGKEYEIETINWSKFLSKIKSFFNDPVGGLGAIFENGFTIYLIVITSIVECKEEKKPEFKTADGVDIFYRERYYYVSNDFIVCIMYAACPPYDNVKNRAFSTKEAAEAFAEEHRPDKSYAMIREALEAGNNSAVFIVEAMARIKVGFNKLKNNQ